MWDSRSAFLELVSEIKENISFELPLYDASKGTVLDLAVVVGGSVGFAVAKQVIKAIHTRMPSLC